MNIFAYNINYLDIFTGSNLYLRVLGQERNVGNTILIEHDKTVIDTVETELGTKITDSDTGQRCVVFEATDLNAEGMRTKVLTI